MNRCKTEGSHHQGFASAAAKILGGTKTDAAAAVRRATESRRTSEEGLNYEQQQEAATTWDKLFYENDEETGDGEWWHVPLDGGQGKKQTMNQEAEQAQPRDKTTNAAQE